MIALATGTAMLYPAAPPCTATETAGLATMVFIALAVGFWDLRRAVTINATAKPA
jgi:hypothetical protein